jgi:hypothetical protein
MPGTFFPGNKSKIRVLGTLIFWHAFEILLRKHKLGFLELFKLIPGAP